MPLRSLALATLLLGVAAAPSQADVTLYTPLVQVIAPEVAFCSAVNTGKKPMNLSLAILDTSGVQVVGGSCPGLGTDQVCQLNLNGFFGYCKIVSNGSKKAVRGSLAVTNANGVTMLSLEAR